MKRKKRLPKFSSANVHRIWISWRWNTNRYPVLSLSLIILNRTISGLAFDWIILLIHLCHYRWFEVRFVDLFSTTGTWSIFCYGVDPVPITVNVCFSIDCNGKRNGLYTSTVIQWLYWRVHSMSFPSGNTNRKMVFWCQLQTSWCPATVLKMTHKFHWSEYIMATCRKEQVLFSTRQRKVLYI